MKVLFWVAILLVAALPGNATELSRVNFVTGQAAYQRGDYALAMEQLTIAAEHGYMSAHTLLGHILRDGHADNGGSEAESHYLQAARHGDCTAQLSLARMYHLGGYKSSDKEKALRWYEVAARNGSVWAQLALAGFFDQGTLVERDNVQAFFWFSVLAARPLEFEDKTSLPLLEVAIRSVVALRDKMTAKQLFDALDLLDEQWVDPMGCDSG